MTFAEKLQTLRKDNKLSQEQLAEKCNVSRQAVSKWELGQGYPETEKIISLCDLFGVDLDYLLRDKENIKEGTICLESNEKSNEIYKAFLGKWVKIFLNDKEYQGLYQVAITAMNSKYILFEMNSRRGALKISDIKSMSNADISSKKLDKMEAISTEQISEEYNPYDQFIGKICEIRLKCNSFFSYPQGYYAVKIDSVAKDGIIITLKEKNIAIKVSDILMVLER